jgi:ribosomal protein S21
MEKGLALKNKPCYSIRIMATNVQISRSNNENAASVLRRFMKKVRGAGFLQAVRDRRYYTRHSSKLRTKNSKIVSLSRTAEYTKKMKDGLIQEK